MLYNLMKVLKEKITLLFKINHYETKEHFLKSFFSLHLETDLMNS